MTNKRGNIRELRATGALDHRDALGRRRIKLTKDERDEFRHSRLVEAAVALFLDLEHSRTWQEIADELGVGIQTLKDITRSEEFDEIYNQHFAELGHDPRLSATKGALLDMLPLAVRTLREMLMDSRTPATVRLNAVKEVFSLTKIQDMDTNKANMQEVLEFLKAHQQSPQISVTNVPEVPEEYSGLYQLPSHIDAEVTEIPE